MARYEIAPTKTNYIKLKQDLAFSREGYELLDQKRSILIVELMGIIDTLKSMQKDLEHLLKDAFQSLASAIQSTGRKEITFLARAIRIDTDIIIAQRRVMGVTLPVIRVNYTENPLHYSLIGNNFWIDETLKNFKQVLKLLGNLAELKISLIRLAEEVKKTIRKVNALEKIAIPDYVETIKYIEDRLEEAERESFFLMKLIKKRLEKKKK
ncbi:MAG: V-type ATP synthase subunit D [bacterium]|nr:V-type ATP synthase subunit D [bacterium]